MSNIIDTLKQREAASDSTARDNYVDFVRQVASGQPVKPDDAEEILRRVARTAPEFETHVTLAKRLNDKRKRAEALDVDALSARYTKAHADNNATFAECRRLREEELPRREREAEAAVRIVEADIRQADRTKRELAQAQAEFDAALTGIPIPPLQPTPAPRASASATPSQSPSPDPWTHDTVLGTDGKVRYVPKNRALS